MTTIVLASGNRKKLDELQRILAAKAVNFVPQSTFDVRDADETGLSFVENALIKARHASALTQLPALADDSGIEVDALEGEPGIYSARFAAMHGKGNGDDANNALLLDLLKHTPEAQRRARYHCAIVLLRHARDPMPLICLGSWEGSILTTPRGAQGFGYDPLFYVPTHHCSAAELAPEIKNAISHRAIALRQLLQQWPHLSGDK
ncbi:MAG: RdgB/HAM1 family non-canonical purine NTP pyrophosphatase [Pseudomonadales bacterium]|jgi:XTP/dITP diphosphohydrolase|nr:RdgB/HAM1 family non-canonical purine NTP pyrophosphatase [Pseudomonadales bacterium]